MCIFYLISSFVALSYFVNWFNIAGVVVAVVVVIVVVIVAFIVVVVPLLSFVCCLLSPSVASLPLQFAL